MIKKLVLTQDDWRRIIASIGLTALVVLEEGETKEELKESIQLHRLRVKLMKWAKDNGIYDTSSDVN